MNATSAGKARKAAELLRKQFGDEAVRVMSDTETGDIAAIPTGSLGLDRALGVGGIPCGRIVEIYGPEASGKTTMMLSLVAQAQKRGAVAAFIDAEHALDRAYAERLGVDVDSLLIAQPSSGEEALEICEKLISTAEVELIVIDSVAALVPKVEIDGEIGDQHVGLQARLMSQALRKLAPVAHRAGSTICFVNQIRMQIGNTYGSPETTTGGRALRFYASVRLDIRRIAGLKDGERVYGSRVRVKVAKNKVAPPHAEAEFDIVFGEGIDSFGELIDIAVDLGTCQKSGAWFSWGEQRLGQGRTKAATYLKEHPEAAAAVEAEIRAVWQKARERRDALRDAA